MVTPGTGSFVRTDLYNIHHIVQNSIMSYPKELIIGLLREEFSRDSYYRYSADEFGYPKVIDHTDLELGAGFDDNEVTRIFIGEPYRFDAIMYPAILVKMTSAKSVPIAMNRNKGVVKYDKELYIDGYGNEVENYIPTHFDLAGAWEGTISIDIETRDSLTRDELVSFIMLFFTDIRFETLRKAGILVKSGQPSLGAISESEDRQQDKLYKATISIEIRTEWRRLIPVESVIERINMCVDFVGNADSENPIINPNFEINEYVSILDVVNSL